ncbi:DNA (cytosine-5)-methyltransferase CMT2 [Raphanus sativus]|nr:DNA (cytosine-5)-methyltransferase CMT2 [Raphanus sativus]
MKLSEAEMSTSRRSTRLNCDSPGARKSPRFFTPVDGKIDNVSSVPITRKTVSSNRKISSAPVKKGSLDSVGLSFEDIAAIGKSLEMGIVSECQDSNAQGRSQVPPKRKLDDCDAALLSSSIELSSQINKRTRRSSRFTTGVENLGDKPVPSITSSRLSGTFEIRLGLCDAKQVRGTEKLVQVRENGNCYEGHGLVSSKQELLNSPTGCVKTTVNGSRVKSLGKRRSSDPNASGVHTSSLKISQNGTSNGLVTASDADNGVSGEMHADATVIYLSDDDEEPQHVQDSVEFLYTTSSDGDVLMQDASGSTLSSGENGRQAPLDQNTPIKSTKGKGARVTRIAVREKHEHGSCFFIGEPIPCEEAKERWRWRYDLKERKSKRKGKQAEDDEDMIVSNVECHYSQAKVDNKTFSLGDFAYVKGEGKERLIGKIIEFFKTTDGESYFRVQWLYRATDTVMLKEAADHETRRLFYSTVMNDNPIDCLISKVTVLQVSPRAGLKPNSIKSDFYFDMEYCVEFSTFRTLRNQTSENKLECCAADVTPTESTESILENKSNSKEELLVLDLYSGCGGMSTGLNLGAKVSGVDVVTKWAIDQELAACESLKLNHPHTQVRNDSAGDFLLLLKEWDKLCKRYVCNDGDGQTTVTLNPENSTKETSESSSSTDDDSEPDEYEVEKLVDICYGDPDKSGESGLKFKVHWKGYSSNEDTWEPAEELSNCEDAMREFVTRGFKNKILPLPGGVGVICGGPPCQGISGYNRHRDVDTPLTDERNQQIGVFMDIVEYLKPKFVLMENVVDLLRLDKGSLGRLALSRLVDMRYQARLGIMTAGCYGLSQFRSRVFMWGADPDMKLPPFPLPTHDVIVRYGLPIEFEWNVVAYSEGQPRNVETALVLKDAISDLPHVSYNETREKMSYESLPETDFQRYIRSTKHEMTGSEIDRCTKRTMPLYDHRPSRLSEDDYNRVCQIPKKKGANFRDLPGIIVRNNTVYRDPSMEPVLLPSGKHLVPEYVFTFQKGKSKRPFGRLWWDETVPTVLTVPSCTNQVFLHPEQDRVLTIREAARLQGFPDYFQFCGTVKQRYRQIGNAVAVSVSRALGYSLGMAFRGLAGDENMIELPQKFSHSSYLQLQETSPH